MVKLEGFLFIIVCVFWCVFGVRVIFKLVKVKLEARRVEREEAERVAQDSRWYWGLKEGDQLLWAIDSNSPIYNVCLDDGEPYLQLGAQRYELRPSHRSCFINLERPGPW